MMGRPEPRMNTALPFQTVYRPLADAKPANDNSGLRLTLVEKGP
jgi:hypothetical protein